MPQSRPLSRRSKSEVLIDVNDVAQDHTTKQTWNAPDKWIWSESPSTSR